MRRFMGLWVAVLLAGCQAQFPPLPQWQLTEGLDDPSVGQIIESSTGRVLASRELVQRLGAAPRVLVGEKHDNADHHALQQWLLRAMESQREQGSLLLEMLVPSQQARVDEVQRRLLAGERVENPPRELAWQSGWGWSLYGPLVIERLRQPTPLLAANLDRAEIMAVYRQAPALPVGRSTAPEVQQALREDIRESHCGLLPESQLPAMLAVQQQRDRRMAERLRQAQTPSLLLAGAFHVRKDLGVPLHLADLGEPQPVVLILAEAGSVVPAEQADYVWYTPATPPEDYCAKLRGLGK